MQHRNVTLRAGSEAEALMLAPCKAAAMIADPRKVGGTWHAVAARRVVAPAGFEPIFARVDFSNLWNVDVERTVDGR